ncbi:glycosyltransferase family 2 protein [Burkholderia sp. AW49-1]
MPLVSIILPVFNGESFISESISSIINQTFSDFELIIVNDGSTDKTQERISEFSDPRIRHHITTENKGTATATNEGLKLATGKYIVLQDADDISEPNRIDVQVRTMNGQPRIAVLGSCMKAFGARDDFLSVPSTDGLIKARLLRGAGNIYNPTAMLRRSFIDRHGLAWNPEYGGAFDWAYFVDVMHNGLRFSNIKDALVKYRIHDNQQSRDSRRHRHNHAKIRLNVIKTFFPHLALEESILLEPLLQWHAPPEISRRDVEAGIGVIGQAKGYVKSVLGEDRQAIDAYLDACHRRWQAALSGN